MNSATALAAFAALGQPIRLEVFRMLIRSGRQGMLAGEIAMAMAARQNTMSMNLSVLTGAGLLRTEREGRGVRYFADMEGLRRLLGYLVEDCCGGDKAACAPFIAALTIPSIGDETMTEQPYNVLFLCTGNSARSIMAEAILNRLAPKRFRGYSAGSHPSGAINPGARALLEKLNYDLSDARSKDWSEFAGPDAPEMDFVFTVCDRAAAEVCPVWPGQPMSAHWGVPDPAKATGKPAEIAVAFAEAFKTLEKRIEVLTALPLASLDKLTLKRRLDDIGKSA